MYAHLSSRIAAGVALSALVLISANAEDRTWNVDPSTEADFNDGANWSAPFVGPWNSTVDNAVISNGGTAVMSSGTATVSQIWVGQNLSGTATGTMNQTGGDIIFNDGLVVGRQGTAVGTYNMTGGTLGGKNLRIGGGTKTSTGTMNISGANTFFTTTQVGTSGVVGIGVPGHGTMNISDSATWTHSGTTVVLVGGDNNAINQNVAGVGELNISSGASVNLTGGGNLAIGRNNGTGTVTIDGGTLGLTGNGVISMGNAYADAGTGTKGGTGVLTLNSGSLTASRINMTTGTNKVAGSGVATVNFNGGTATLSGMGKGDGAADVHFNGSEIIAAVMNSDFFTGFDGINLDIQAGGQKFNTNGNEIGISQGMTGLGGLTKLGEGNLILDGANVYGGATLVEAGSLVVNGSISGSGLTVAGGAGLILQSVSGLGDAIVLTLFTGSTVNLNFSGTDTIGMLNLNGSLVQPGTYSVLDLQNLGTGINFTGASDAFLTVAAIPEPSTIALLAGVAGVSLVVRIRRNRVKI
jgi:autotransporter-associated beta strand protein